MAKKKAVKKSARQKTLPTMEDRAISSLENLARDYADVRDERQQLTTREVELKDNLLSTMKKLGRETYKRGNIEITVVHEKEGVKVRVKSMEQSEPDEESVAVSVETEAD